MFYLTLSVSVCLLKDTGPPDASRPAMEVYGFSHREQHTVVGLRGVNVTNVCIIYCILREVTYKVLKIAWAQNWNDENELFH